MSDARVLVTGAGGFIGHALCAHFAATGRASRAMYHLRRPHAGGIEDFIAGDLATMEDAELDAALAGTSAVVHLAGRVHVLAETAADPQAAYRAANVVGTERLVRAAVRTRVARFVFASTVKVNGESSAAGHPFAPEDPPSPDDAYARSKLDAERTLTEACAGTATAPIILRLPLVYGPGVGGNFLLLLDAIARGRGLPLGAVRNRRSLLYVGNLVEAIDAALDVPRSPSGVHYVADTNSVSVPDLVRAIAAALGIAPEMRSVPVPLLLAAATVTGKRAAARRLVESLEVDTRSFREATGWVSRYTMDEGLRETARWWRLRHSI